MKDVIDINSVQSILRGLQQPNPANMIMAEFNKKIEREIELLEKMKDA
jgi:hypothetical protein